MSLRTHLYLILIGLALSITAGLSGIFYYYSQRTADRLVDDFQQEMMVHVQDALHNYTRSAQQINQLNQAAFEKGLIALDNYDAWAKQLQIQAEQFSHISYITISQPDGTWFGLKNMQPRFYKLSRADGKQYHYPWNADGLLENPEQVKVDYTIAGKSWYEAPLKARRPIWSPIYNWVDPPTLAISLGSPVFHDDGSPRALFSVDLSLREISYFLRQFSASNGSGIYIVDKEWNMVASSALFPVFHQSADGKQERVSAMNYRDTALVQALSSLRQRRSDKELLSEQQHLLISADNEKYRVVSQPFFTANGLEWLVISMTPESQLLEGIYQGLGVSFLALLLLLLIALLFAGTLTNRWIRPLGVLAEKVNQIRWFNLQQNLEVRTHVREINELSESLDHMQAGLQSFAKYVPRDLVKQILNEGEVAQLGGEKRTVTVLFADLQGYSTLVEDISAEKTLALLNQFFSSMQQVVAMYGGTILEQRGDGVLAVFGAPHVLQQHAENAVRCALDMQDALQELNTHWQEQGLADVWNGDEYKGLAMRIGLHRGAVVAGNIGGDEYMKYGVVGDVVNVAARLEKLNKDFETWLTVSSQVFNMLTEDLSALFEHRGEVLLKGRHQQQLVYTLKESGAAPDSGQT